MQGVLVDRVGPTVHAVTADAPTGIADCYLQVHQRIDGLARSLPPGELATPVPACPGWDVRAVLGHLAGTVEWVLAGRLQGLPSEDDTAAQVAEMADRPLDELLDGWAAKAPSFAELVEGAGVWPAAIDIATHEQDIRGALGRPGARDGGSTALLAGALLQTFRPSQPIRIQTDTRTLVAGGGEPALSLRTTDFEVLRWRLGRRSRAQMAAMEWTGDPSPVLEELFFFGPAEEDVIE